MSETTQQDNKVAERIFEGYGEDPQSLSSYATLIGLFNLILAVFLFFAKRAGHDLPERMELKDITLLGVGRPTS